MNKKWVAIGKNGELYDESKDKWEDVKNKISELSMIIGEQKISLPKGMDEYIQAKTARAILGQSSQAIIESRYIACKLGNNTIRVRVNESSNNISIEVE